MKRLSHRNPHGHWCRCTFGSREPYVSKREQEKLGKVAMWHEASKYDWLMARPDVKDNPLHKFFVERLNTLTPQHDALAPWLLRELKKGRLEHVVYKANEGYVPVNEDVTRVINPTIHPDTGDGGFQDALRFTSHTGKKTTLSPDHLDQIQEWMQYMKQAKKGIDIMQHEIGPAVHEATKSDLGGEVVHEFDNGYSVVKLRNKRDMEREGNRMDHCIGSNGMGYIEKLRDGEGLFYSLRDEQNNPHGTVELSKTENEYYKCPDCGQFTTGQSKYLDGKYQTVCPNDDKVLTSMDEDTRTWKNAEGVKSFPVDLDKIGHAPSAQVTSIEQMFGPHDERMQDHHVEMFNQFFGKHGHPWRESDGEGEEEEYEPWWDSYYQVDGPSTLEEYIAHANGEYESEAAPEEYERARRDAYEHDMEEPELEVGAPDHDNIWHDLVYSNNDVDPHAIDELFKHAKDMGDDYHFLERAKEWLEEEYYPYLDPYGTFQGEGHGRDLTQTVPRNSEPAVNEPGAHFPENTPDIMYMARNLEFQLDKHMPYDSQTGERRHPSALRNRYPEMQPGQQGQNPNSVGPKRPEPASPYGNMPGRSPQTETLFGDGVRVRTGPGEPAQRPDPVFGPTAPANPAELFEPGAESTRTHQRALPIENAWDAADPTVFPQGQQQGELMPRRWYIDFSKMRVQQTHLPEHLFPPDRYAHTPGPGSWKSTFTDDDQTPPLWQNRDEISQINTQNELETKDTPKDFFQGDPRPFGEWNAKVSKIAKISELDPAVQPGFLLPGHEWRIPVAYHHASDNLYVGKPGMEHKDMMECHGVDENPWGVDWDGNGDYVPGYIDTEGKIGSGGLYFFKNDRVPQPERFHDYVHSKYGVRADEEVPANLTAQEEDDIWKTSSEEDLSPAGLGDRADYSIDSGTDDDPRSPQRARFLRRQRLDDAMVADWEANPNPQKWTPGEKGKAFMDTEGVLHTWNNDEASRYWMHYDQAEMRGVETNGATYIYMNPDGRVQGTYLQRYSPELAKQMAEQNPQLKFEPVEPDLGDEDIWDNNY